MGDGSLRDGGGAIARVIPWSGSRFSSSNQFPCMKKNGESGSQTGFVVEEGSLNGWEGGGYQTLATKLLPKAFLLFNSRLEKGLHVGSLTPALSPD